MGAEWRKLRCTSSPARHGDQERAIGVQAGNYCFAIDSGVVMMNLEGVATWYQVSCSCSFVRDGVNVSTTTADSRWAFDSGKSESRRIPRPLNECLMLAAMKMKH